jgi:hypothetical protein
VAKKVGEAMLRPLHMCFVEVCSSCLSFSASSLTFWSRSPCSSVYTLASILP